MTCVEDRYDDVGRMSTTIGTLEQFHPYEILQPIYKKGLKEIKCSQYIVLVFLALLIIGIILQSTYVLLPQMKQKEHTVKNCRNGWTHYGGYCYKAFPSEKLSWYDAEFYCVQHMNGCHLPSIHNYEEYRFVLGLWSHPPPGRMWFGGKYSHLKGKVIWTDESCWDFDKFSPGEPNHLNTSEKCIEDDRRFKGWNDAYCGIAMNVLCKCTS
uniref:lectin-like isoform X2 n=1 Tax=Myxine glutinosa TaxID=7769 RepID=UPI00358E1B9B